MRRGIKWFCLFFIRGGEEREKLKHGSQFFQVPFPSLGQYIWCLKRYHVSVPIELFVVVTEDDALSVCAEKAFYPSHMPCHPSEYRLRHITFLKAQHGTLR